MLLEREWELERLTAAIDGVASSGVGRAVVISGSAGIGKTRLLNAATELASRRGLRVLRAVASELESGLTFGIVRDLLTPAVLDSVRGDAPDLFDGPAKLARGVFGLEDAAWNGDFANPLFGLFWLVINVAADGPLVLAIDDLQWADPESSRFLGYLIKRLDDYPVIVVATVRTGDPASESDGVEQILHTADVLRPGPLSPAAVGTMLGTALPSGTDEGTALEVHRLTGGNPLWVSEVLATLAGNTGSSSVADAVEQIADGSVSRAVLVRVARISPAAVSLARALSVFPGGALLEDVTAVSGLTRSDVMATADELVRADVLRVGERLEFAHPVLRAAVYRDMGAFQKGVLHAAAAAVVRRRGAPAETVADQLLLAPPAADPDVVEILRAAADRARSAGAPAAAARYLQRAEAEVPDTRWEIALALAQTLHAAGNPAAVDAGRRAVAAATSPAEHVDAALTLADILDDFHNGEGAMELLLPWRDLPQSIDRERGLLVQVRLVDLAQTMSSPLRAELADALPRDLHGRTRAERQAIVTRAKRAYDRCEPHRDVVALLVQAVEAADSEGELVDTAWLASATALPAGALDTVENWCHRAFAYADSTGQVVLRLGMLMTLSRVLGYQGDFAAAAAVNEDAVRLAADVPGWRDLHVLQLAEWQTLQGRLEAAHATLSDLRPDLSSFARGFANRCAGRLALAEHRPPDAITSFRAVHALSLRRGLTNPGDLPHVPDLALALHATGQHEEAIGVIGPWLELADKFGAPRWLGIGLRTLGVIVGGKAGIEHLHAAVEVLRPEAFKHDLALAELELGAALRRRNLRTDARPHLASALDYAERAGVAPIATRARDELRAAGGRPRRPVLSGVDALTPSELRIARLAAGGLTNREIAAQLFLTPKTIEMHLANVYRKLGVTSRRELPEGIGQSSALGS